MTSQGGEEREALRSFERLLAERGRVEEGRLSRIEARMDSSAAAVAEIAADVKSLLASRSFAHGAYRTLVVVASVVSLLVSVSVAVVKARWLSP